MMKDISLGKVNCIVVKDLSRFGRDYIEVGRLIQKILPAFAVRFIAIMDHYDSKTATGSETSFILPMKNFINDSYCRDISKKVKSHQQIKREKGEFIGAFTVYGYRKSLQNRNYMEKDPYAAKIVRKIYEWRLLGISMLAIAERLNQAGILSPMEYKRMNGENYYTGFCTDECAKWSAAAVKRILENETYTGTLVQGKEERINYKVKKSILKKKEDWIRVLDCHEAIITKEEYEMVQRLLSVPVRVGKDMDKAKLFAGLLFCADCKKPMIRRINRYKGKEKVFYICSTKNRGLGCSRHSVEETVLLEYVKEGMEKIFYIEEGRQREEILKESKKKKRISEEIGEEKSISEEREKKEIGKEKIKKEKIEKEENKKGLAEKELDEENLMNKELEKLKSYREYYQKLCLSLEESFTEGILTKEEAESLSKIYRKQKKGIEEAMKKQQRACEFASDSKKEWEKRKQILSFLDQIEIEEGSKVVIVLKDGRICRFPEGNGYFGSGSKFC